MMAWIKEQLKALYLPSKTTDNKIKNNGISKTNKAIVWRGKNAINMHQTLLQKLSIPWRLRRKWQKIDCLI